MRILSAFAVVSTLALTQAAFAADMPRKAPIAPAPVPVAPSWTGFYVGLNLGYGWSTDQSAVISANDPSSQTVFTLNPNLNPSGLKSNGPLGGLQLGYNWQFAPNWVLGFETDFQVSDLNDTATAPVPLAGFPFSSVIEQQINWFGTVRGRLGFLITPNWLVYGTGGFAYGRVEQSYAFVNNSLAFLLVGAAVCSPNTTCTFGSNTETRTGWTAGGGFEYLLPNIRILNSATTVKLEYLYVNLGSQNVISPWLSAPAQSFTAAFDDAAFHVVRAGVNVKF
jgi:outer membrane immunogenic protein